MFILLKMRQFIGKVISFTSNDLLAHENETSLENFFTFFRKKPIYIFKVSVLAFLPIGNN